MSVTDTGRAVLAGLRIEVPHKRPLLRDRLDWTERREPLSGAVPAAILTRAPAAGGLTRVGDRGSGWPAAAPAWSRPGVPDSGVRSPKAPDAAGVGN